MSEQTYVIQFSPATHPPVTLPAGANLSEHLNVNNSPVLFGCRMGLCGTCLSEVIEGAVPAPSADEQELLDIIAPDNQRARLACQLELCTDFTLTYLGNP